jgi:hypothetical protein
MSQRLIRKTNSPIGTTSLGRVVYGIYGGDPDNPDDKTGDSGDGQKDGENGSEGTGSEGQDDSAATGEAKVSKEEIDRLTERMKAADRRAAAAEAKVKEFEDKDKSETERLTEQVTTLQSQVQERDEVIKNLRFENAFALNAKYSWHDPQVVLGLVKGRDDVTIEEDGTVKGLNKALDAIAKEKSFLVKTEGTGGSTPPPSGSSTGSNGKNGSKNVTDAEALRKKYPALNI